jgi:ribonuclease III
LFKLPFFSKKRSASELELIRFIVLRFGYRPKEIKFFQKAITHKSYAQVSEINSNERLEFLGDAILDAIVAEYLFQRFPGEDEGYLTKLKSKVVSRKTLGEIAESMNLRSILLYNAGRSINLNTIEGNAFEAIIGAIYLDGGFEAAKRSMHQYVFRKYVDINRLLEEEIDFKSKLFIWCQRNKLAIEFRVITEENIGGAWNYEVIATINERDYGKGTGTSKKAAEQAAAQETLQLMGEI